MSPSKVPFGTQLPPDLVDRLRQTVVHLQRKDTNLTISAFVENALTQALDNLPNEVIPPESTADPAGITDPGAGLRPRPGRRVTVSRPAEDSGGPGSASAP